MSAFQEGFARRDDTITQRYDYDDTVVFVADIGSGHEGSVDILDQTAIVVVGDDQYEFEIPAGEARASMANGVVTVEVER